MAGDLFERLAKRRPPQTNAKLDGSGLAYDLQKLHNWLQHTDDPTICLRDICHRGPRCARTRTKAMGLVEILIGNGWLTPIKTHRYDRRAWRIIRGPDKYPTIATMATTASAATHLALPQSR
jgi:hypothetical protein